jgi:hypothetical protein
MIAPMPGTGHQLTATLGVICQYFDLFDKMLIEIAVQLPRSRMRKSFLWVWRNGLA